jgi:LysR family nitrogen assimilation transcriptional regulator
MDLRQLRYFLAIVEEGSITRAAARLNVAQPALSLHVRKMEETLSTPLLVRGPTGVEPTMAGQLLARRATALVGDFDRAVDELRSFGKSPAGTVRIGLPGTISGILSVPLIARCRERLPDVRIVIAEAMSGFVREWLLDGGIELAVIYAEMNDEAARAELLLKEEMVVLTAPSDAGAGDLSGDAFKSMPLILPSGTHGLRTLLDRELRLPEAGVTPIIEVDSYGSIKRLVEDGHGASVLPLHAVAPEAAAGRLRIRRIGPPRLWRSAHLAHRANRTLSRAAAEVRALLKEVVSDLIASGEWAGAVRPPDARDP